MLGEAPPGECCFFYSFEQGGVRFERKTFSAVGTWQPTTSSSWVSWRSQARSPLTRPVAKAKAKVEAKARLKAKLRAKKGNKAMELVKAQVSPFSTLPLSLLSCR